ncbi:AAA family ATPase [Falsihalocynthiibacter arcticus]|uniref:AAA family ATPase n=1 Tax=Falsihalocynthiibacter arcticus TaxID=1579316 RepID=UPI003002061E
MPIVNEIVVKGFRKKDYFLKFQDGRLVLVGENGAGKTTILQIVQNFLVCRWSALSDFDFKSCSVLFDDGTQITIEHSELLLEGGVLRTRLLKDVGPRVSRKVVSLLEQGELDVARKLFLQSSDVPPWEADEAFFEFSRRLRHWGSPASDIKSKRSRRLADKAKQMKLKLNLQVIYLPTYRRIEKELHAVLKMKDSELARKYRSNRSQPEDAQYLELVEFGMGDVQELVSQALRKIRDFQLTQSLSLSISSLSDIVKGKFRDDPDIKELSIDEARVDSVLARIDSSVLQNLDVGEIKRSVMTSLSRDGEARKSLSIQEKIVLSYFKRLLDFHNDLKEREASIASFCEVCESFMKGKKFSYDVLTGTIGIQSNETEIELSELSSGEKQIVSLFCHLLLSGNEAFFIIVDEPELSLSVPWQRQFLERVSNLTACSGLLAVTHSPFIYDNSLRECTRSFGQLAKGADWGNVSELKTDE